MKLPIKFLIYQKESTLLKKETFWKTPHGNRHKPTLFDGYMDWHVIADVESQLIFPTEITSTRQRPDLVIWSVNSKKVIITELTVPFEDNIIWAHQRKLKKYEDLREQCIKNGWSTDIFPLEIGCQGFISNSTSTFLYKLGLSPSEKRKYIKKIQNKTVNASERIWQSYKANTIH